MAITFEKTPLEWNNAGAEPSTDLKTNGFVAGYKPAADTFNYQINNSSACLTELQTKLSGVDDDVTTLEGTVSELDQNAIRGIRGKGTLITPMSDQTVNITAASIGAAASSHNHSASNITSGTLPIARGGTGGTTVVQALNNLYIAPTVLYNNSSGSYGTITLSSSIDNFTRIGVYAKNRNSDKLNTVYNEIYVTSQIKFMSLSASSETDSTHNCTVWRTAVINFSGTTLTFSTNFASSYHETAGYNSNSSDGFKILRVVGYKY